MAKEKTR